MIEESGRIIEKPSLATRFARGLLGIKAMTIHHDHLSKPLREGAEQVLGVRKRNFEVGAKTAGELGGVSGIVTAASASGSGGPAMLAAGGGAALLMAAVTAAVSAAARIKPLKEAHGKIAENKLLFSPGVKTTMRESYLKELEEFGQPTHFTITREGHMNLIRGPTNAIQRFFWNILPKTYTFELPKHGMTARKKAIEGFPVNLGSVVHLTIPLKHLFSFDREMASRIHDMAKEGANPFGSEMEKAHGSLAGIYNPDALSSLNKLRLGDVDPTTHANYVNEAKRIGPTHFTVGKEGIHLFAADEGLADHPYVHKLKPEYT